MDTLQILILVTAFASIGMLVLAVRPFMQKHLEDWQNKRMDKITPKLDDMFLNVPMSKLIMIDLLGPLVLGAAAFFLLHNFVAVTVGVILGLALPLIVIKEMEKARRQKFAQQLIDGLMVLSGSLRAGLSLLQAFEVLAEEMPPPISQEFSLMLRENRIGVPLETSLNNLKKRMKIEELDLIITAILVSRETGGDLTETFNQLIFTIRERTKILGRLKALTVQAKLQGIIMGGLPVAFAIFVYSFNPHFFDIMLEESVGRLMIGASIIMEVLGIIFIRKFSSIEV
ncbi:MAG: type II secretion system F family protein [Candidatus Omnitrophica bacterium]|nr:type II secretion system F family protein [Candidatus Omnitrophota bacterium]MDD5654782.1 type II secretion system F family protein [Candidatus Omnitrophota bacterium]